MTEKSIQEHVSGFLRRNPDVEVYYVIEHFKKKFPSWNQYTISRSYYRAKERIAKDKQKEALEQELTREKGNVQDKKWMKSKREFKALSLANIEQYRNHFKEFVGYIDEKGEVHEGEAFPPPINRNGEYLGILDYELDAFDELFENLSNLFKWAREHGKTYICAWFIQWTMKYFGENWLYLSLTEIRYKVGNWIYLWSKYNHYQKQVEKGAKQNTYQKFVLKNGATLEIHEALTEDVVGYHDWNIAMDDVVKKKWETLRSEERKMELQWQHNLNYIGRKRLMIYGTRKFEGDFLQYLEEHIDDLNIDIKTPFIMVGEFPKWTPKLDKDGNPILLAPKLHTLEELNAKKNEDLKAWHAEEMQNPHPYEGGTFTEDDIVYKDTWGNWADYNIAVISVDPAWTIDNTSDKSGITITLKRANSRKMLVIRSFIDRVKVENWQDDDDKWHDGLLTIIERYFQFVKMYFPKIWIIVPIEQNSAGKVITEFARNRSDQYEFAGHIIEINAVTEKLDRIETELLTPIKTKMLEFLRELEGSELIEELLTFPSSKWIDGVDSLGTGVSELWRLGREAKLEDIERVRDFMSKKRGDAHAPTHVAMSLADALSRKYKFGKRRRSMFG